MVSKHIDLSKLPVLTDEVEMPEVIVVDDVLAGLERTHGFVFRYADADLYVAPPPPPQPEVLIRARVITTVRPTFSQTQITCRDFDWQNLELCQTYLNKNIDLSIEDDNGLFKPNSPQKITAFKAVGTKLLITTENQE